MDEPKLTLFTDGLLSKWGFNDGDMPDDVWDYLEQRGCRMHKVHWRDILVELVKSDLVPALDQRVEVVEILTNHNPIRATSVDGENVEGLWYSTHWGESLLSPAWIEIDMAVVADMTGEL